MDDAIRRILMLPAIEAAPLILGMGLYVDDVGGRIAEVEAYMEDDPASHCYGGPRGRNHPMFLAGGHVYIYRSYGVHWCMNLVTGPEGRGEAVLIRALEPLRGIDSMRQRRPNIRDDRLCSGPGNLARALGATGDLSGTKLGKRIIIRHERKPSKVVSSPRIGITKAADRNWRFCDEESRSLSRNMKIGKNPS
ncbi:MAG: DNA-3-methyladenine glycosylase [Armatimonadetes bacterium]|nr:DNA-3-methyladenine glycosylase [Armatimonadota bacterium]